MPLRIYLDTSVYNRPFDDQQQPRIWLETMALSVFLQMVEAGVSDTQIMQEANRLLMERFSPAKLVRFWAVWQAGGGDYLAWREETFAAMSVAQLYEEIVAHQTEESNLQG